MKNNLEITICPSEIAHKMIEIADLKEGDKVLDPCRGGGIIYNNLPLGCVKSWAEIKEGVDFFQKYNENDFFDCIIMNPPINMLYNFLSSCMKMTDKIVFIINTQNLIINRIRWLLNNKFSITYMYLFEVDYYYGSNLILKCERGKENILNCAMRATLCDRCGAACGRGRNGANPNICKKLSMERYEGRIKEKHIER